MIYDHSTLNPREVVGVLQTFDNPELPVRWWFRDDELGIKFVCYTKWLDDMETNSNQVVMKILQKFCMNNDIDINEVYMARLTMMVQDENGRIVLPEHGYPNPRYRFLYFLSGSDKPLYVNGVAYRPIMGGAMLFDGSAEYSFVSPLNDNFFMVAEVEFS